ncbi:MAG: hypothetical protein U1F71_21225 [Verrucomicrobiaceae bacterium]
MKMIDLLPFVGMLVGMIWVSTVYWRSKKRLLSAYQDEGVSPKLNRFTVQDGGAWSIFKPTQGDSQKIIELKAALIKEAWMKLKPAVMVTVVLIALLIAVSVQLSKQ